MNNLKEEEYLKIFFDNSPDALFLMNAEDASIKLCNDKAVAMFEMDSKEEFTGKFAYDFHANSFTKTDFQASQKSLEENKVYKGEYQYKTKKGNIFWAIIEASIVKRNGVKYQIARIADITKEKKREQTQLKKFKNLIKESNHRIKNNLTTVLSLIDLAIIGKHELNEAKFREVYASILAITVLHDKLSHLDDALIGSRTYLEDLIEKSLDLHPDIDNLDLNLDLVDQKINQDIALNLGLIFSELISNSIKHAYNEDEENFIDVKCYRKGDDLKLRYLDNGLQNTTIDNSGLGSEILLILLEQVNGKFEYAEDGAVLLTVPL